MARVDCTGAELNDLDELNSTTVTINSTFASDPSGDGGVQPRSGSRLWQIACNSVLGSLERAFGSMTITGAPSSVAVRLSVATTGVFNETSANPDGFLKLNFGAGETLTVRLTQTAGGSYDIDAVGTNGVSTVSVPAVSVVGTNSYFDICVRTTINTGAGVAESFTLRVTSKHQNIDITQTSGSANWATAGLASIDFGVTDLIDHDRQIVIDDIIIDNTNADINDARFLAFLPPDNTHSPQDQWVSVGGAASTTVAITDNLDATLIRASGATAANIAFEMTDLSGTMPSSGFLTKAFYGSCRRGSALDTQAFTYRIRKSDDTSQGSTSIASATAATTSRSALVITTSYTQADLNGLYYRFEYPGAVGGQSSIEEVWGYFEIEANPALEDSATASEETSIEAEIPLEDSVTASEALAIGAEIPLEDGITASEELAIEAEIPLEDSVTASEDVAITQFGAATVTNTFILNE